MKSLVIAFAGLLALAGCQNASPSSSAAGPDPDAGAVTFRLQATEVSVLEVTSDSIKIEAVRSGYPTVVAAGSLREAVAVEGLQPGPWSIRVAAFDRTHAIHWYGDTLAEIRGGRKTEVVVRLRKATGTAIVRIILDSGVVVDPDTSFHGPRQDTLWTSVDSGRVSSSPVPQSLAGASRADYVFVRTPYNCGAPNPRLSRWVDTAGTVYLILYNKGPLREIACTMEYREQVLVYKPYSSTENIVVQDLQGKVIRLPSDSTDLPIAPDTLWNAVFERGSDTVRYYPWKATAAVRSNGIVFVQVPYDCNRSTYRLSKWTDTAGTVHLAPYSIGAGTTRMGCDPRDTSVVLAYKPGSSIENVEVETGAGKIIRLPGTRPNPGPSALRFKVFEFVQGGGFTADASSYQLRLDSSGLLQVIHSTTVWSVPLTRKDSQLVDPAPQTKSDTTARKLDPSELENVKRLLADTSMAYPDTLPIPPFMCADAPWWKGFVSYNDGHAARYSKPEVICSGLPANYQRIETLAWRLISPPLLIDGGIEPVIEPITPDTLVLIDGGIQPIITKIQ